MAGRGRCGFGMRFSLNVLFFKSEIADSRNWIQDGEVGYGSD